MPTVCANHRNDPGLVGMIQTTPRQCRCHHLYQNCLQDITMEGVAALYGHVTRAIIEYTTAVTMIALRCGATNQKR